MAGKLSVGHCHCELWKSRVRTCCLPLSSTHATRKATIRSGSTMRSMTPMYLCGRKDESQRQFIVQM